MTHTVHFMLETISEDTVMFNQERKKNEWNHNAHSSLFLHLDISSEVLSFAFVQNGPISYICLFSHGKQFLNILFGLIFLNVMSLMGVGDYDTPQLPQSWKYTQILFGKYCCFYGFELRVRSTSVKLCFPKLESTLLFFSTQLGGEMDSYHS